MDICLSVPLLCSLLHDEMVIYPSRQGYSSTPLGCDNGDREDRRVQTLISEVASFDDLVWKKRKHKALTPLS